MEEDLPVERVDRVSAWQPVMDPLQLKLLGKLQEELGELQSAVARCIIQGVDGVSPDDGKPNRLWLQEELADVEATMDLVVVHYRLDEAEMAKRCARKRKALKRWHEMG